MEELSRAGMMGMIPPWSFTNKAMSTEGDLVPIWQLSIKPTISSNTQILFSTYLNVFNLSYFVSNYSGQEHSLTSSSSVECTLRHQRYKIHFHLSVNIFCIACVVFYRRAYSTSFRGMATRYLPARPETTSMSLLLLLNLHHRGKA